jgi:hypothetical protein
MEQSAAEQMEADYSRAYAEFSVAHAQSAPLVAAVKKVRGCKQGAGQRSCSASYHQLRLGVSAAQSAEFASNRCYARSPGLLALALSWCAS